MKLVKPDYNNCLTNLSNSILKYFDIDVKHNTLEILDNILKNNNSKNVVLILYDGMGDNLLQDKLPSESFLIKNRIGNITSVFPATTVAATTSILSALFPCETGYLGWDQYFKTYNETITMFLGTKKDTNEKVLTEEEIKKILPYKNIISLINEKYKAYKIMPFGDKHYTDLNDMNNKIIELCNNNERKFIYAYYEEPDHTMHKLGTDDKEVNNIFKTINASSENLCNNLKNTIVIIVADHGHLNSEPITLSDYPDIFNLLKNDISIEGRACTFFIKKDKNKEFEKLFNKYFGLYFKLYTKKEVIENKMFGIGKENKYYKDFIGDYLAIAIKDKYFRYNENSVLLKSMHAGITEDEMLIPLIVKEV